MANEKGLRDRPGSGVPDFCQRIQPWVEAAQSYREKNDFAGGHRKTSISAVLAIEMRSDYHNPMEKF